MKGTKYLVMEDLTLGGGHTMQYTDAVSQKCTLETYIFLLTNVTSTHLIKKIKENEKGWGVFYS